MLGHGHPAQSKLPASLWSPEPSSCQMHLNESSGEWATMDGQLLRENSNNAAIHLFVKRIIKMTASTLYPPSPSACTRDWITKISDSCFVQWKSNYKERARTPSSINYKHSLSRQLQREVWGRGVGRTTSNSSRFHSSCSKKCQSSFSTQEIFVHQVSHACSKKTIHESAFLMPVLAKKKRSTD